MLPAWARLGGSTRYDTMSAIVERAFPEASPYAVLVSGADFPDALSAASLAGAYGCPIVTVPTDLERPMDVRGLDTALDELASLKAKRVIVLKYSGLIIMRAHIMRK